ncbi:MAG TPA: hypothetical protein PLD25_25650 [Chloroflexota bacterium]|nr:hypothetical protein [Chloroflexota bacterium]HUM70799.1 hypothetical protein [Chloroflexota bacterium]
MKRPIGVTVLAVAAGIAAVLNVIIALRFIFPSLGPVNLPITSLWYALVYGLMAYIWFWVMQMLWNLEEAGWIFVAAISLINLVFNFVILVTGGEWVDVQTAVILNGLVLIYALLPGTKRAFGRQ